MTSTTFFHELKESYRWVLKKNIGILVLLTILMFLALPFVLFMEIPGWTDTTANRFDTEAERLQGMQSYFASFMGYAPVAATVLCLIFSAVLCVILFNYMEQKRSVDLFHALPVRRETLLLGRWCAGATILFVPLLFNFFILWAAQAAYGIGANGWTVFAPMLQVMLMAAAAFTSCVFMAVCSGTMLDTALSVIGVNIGYPLLIICVYSIANNLLPGTNISTYGHAGILTAFAPFAAAFIPFVAEPYSWFVPWWIVLTLLMLAGTVFLYQRRKSESAESCFAFPIPKILIRFLLTAVGGMGFGLILGEDSTAHFFMGLIMGSLIAHVVVESIYSRGFKQLKKSFRWYAVFAAAFLVIYAVLATGFFGYDTRIPSAGEVESVSVSTGYGEYSGGYGCNVVYGTDGSVLKDLSSPLLTEPDSIKTVLETQEKVIQLHHADGYPYKMADTAGTMLELKYHLKNGKTFTRSYQYYDSNDSEAYQDAVQSITSLPEYKGSTDMIFYLEAKDIKTISVNQSDSDAQRAFVPDETQKEELFEALRQDLLDQKINYIPSTKNGEYYTDRFASFDIEFNDNIEPGSRLKALLGGYDGKINLSGTNEYDIYDENSAAYALLQKYGWL